MHVFRRVQRFRPAMDVSSLAEAVDFHASRVETSSHVAVCGGSGEGGVDALTWAELRTVVHHVADCLYADMRTALQPVQLVALLARRSPLWLAATLGAVRCQVPFVWMSAGELPPKSQSLERARNEDILRRLRPGLVILGSSLVQSVVPDWGDQASGNTPVLVRLATLVPSQALRSVSSSFEARPAAADAIFCYMLTGGTTGRSKCVKVSHAMAAHELRSYPSIAPELLVGGRKHCERMLQHTPVLWAASALGQVDIAFAFGATLCIADGLDLDTLQTLRPTLLGVVPSGLEAFGALFASGVFRRVGP